ncbi:MAG: acetyl-CoA carboxylase carboxyltransferase subunit alpha [Alicyclobacillus herbarius]|uniref:acetyl-CoA carboxylase carboxyltransferase subunit alpha n=1 Tax=Alicyclobacillus herbarius TaxID=122960 RepID=UPI002355420C|nr:acetyl-CoA carboxylase carboxyltransferase subunit alpha [Alicyclobacillus herbarius]MCL6631118.1 acetyl-CoA carboxylase carboxyltransferase subunit alpha [Alicyclobacillus herbarius]
MAGQLEFERPIEELTKKLSEVRAFMHQHGIDLSEEVARLEAELEQVTAKVYGELTPWQRVQIARQPGRPTTLDYIRGLCSEFIELHGDRNYRDDPAVIGGIGLIDDQPVTVIGTQKGRDTKENVYRNFGMANPEGYRKALRLMKQAEKFHRPVVLFIDTAGAYPGMSAEERGQSEAIARNLVEMSGLRVPTICFVTGEGGSGGALGLGLTDRIYVLEYAWYSVIAPESAAAILWKDSTLGPRAAEMMRIGARNLVELGVADEVIPEPLGGAQKNPQEMIARVADKAVAALRELVAKPLEQLLAERYDKYRQMGVYSES